MRAKSNMKFIKEFRMAKESNGRQLAPKQSLGQHYSTALMMNRLINSKGLGNKNGFRSRIHKRGHLL